MMRKTRAARSPFGKGTESLRRYTMWSAYFLMVAAPLLILLLVIISANSDPLAAGLVIFHIALAVFSILFLQDAVNKLLKNSRLRNWVGVGLALSTAACYALSILLTEPTNASASEVADELMLLSFSLTTAGFIPLLAIIPLLSMWQTIVASMGAAFLTAVGLFVALVPAGTNILDITPIFLGTFVFNSIFFVMMGAIMRWSFAVLAAVSSQEQVDAVKADLAVAEERLRIARDLHDLFGRTLTAVALKSELTAALAEKENAPQAAAEAQRVKALADEALKEVRAVLAEYRRPDLRQELAGAISLLASAGIPTRIIGERDAPRWAEEYLALVLREGATNIVRHSAATHADIRLKVTDTEASITLTNDQAHTKTPASTNGKARNSAAPGGDSAETPSSGLDSLRARIAEVGGTLTTEQLGHIFSLTARIPALANSESREDTL
ncbi:MAG: histidine kinase [Actinomycetaceae bacterium]|nr:histidine kinase [Actinomycetaceae bacterium]